MFHFWGSTSKGCEKTVESSDPSPSPACGSTVAPALETSAIPHPTLGRPPKRRRSSASEGAGAGAPGHRDDTDAPLPTKRAKAQGGVALPSPQSLSADDMEEEAGLEGLTHDSPVTSDLDAAREVIEYQFGLEILLKHDELRLINQELAKCQVALEQLRRCHLIPYPVTCPTPAQMLDISSGKGPALQNRSGEPVPRWAPPFGVVDGPYARHYAKWLIPDPMFDGVYPDPHTLPYASRAKNAGAEGRTTRNSLSDATSFTKGRPVRGTAGQKLQALSSGYPQPKDKQGPCILKRSDGQTVKLICIDCHRWDFSSTQGFINHCRIAHRRDFKSHEEAAVHCGHPIETDDSPAAVGDEKPVVSSPMPAPSFSGLVHPFARNEAITEQQAYAALRSRISSSLALYHAGKLPNVKSIPGAPPKRSAHSAAKPTSQFLGAQSTPYLSQMLRKKEFKGNLGDMVGDAKTKVDLDDMFAASEDSEDPDTPTNAEPAPSHTKTHATTAARTPAAMRVPTRTVESPVPLPTIPRPTSSKGRAVPSAFSRVPQGPETPENDEGAASYDEMDMDLSPNAIASNNAPSLVSDDGEYDDSDDGSSSETSEAMEEESISDVAEINIDEDNEVQDHGTPRPIRHHRTNSGTTVKLKKDEGKHVTFVTPITGNTGKAKGRRKQNA